MAGKAESDSTGYGVIDFRDVAAIMDDAVIVTNADNHIAFVNPSAEKVTRCQLEALKDRPLDDVFLLFTNHSKPISCRALLLPEPGGIVRIPPNTCLIINSARMVPISGTIKRVNVPDSSEPGMIMVFHEDTSSHTYAFNCIQDIIGVQDGEYNVVHYNPAGYDYLQTRLEKATGKKCFELIGRSKPCDPCATTECIRTKKQARIDKYLPDRNMWLDCRSYPVLDENGRILYIIEHLRDITDRKLVENKLGLFKQAVDHSSDAISMTTFQGHIYYRNARFSELFSESRDHPIMNRFTDSTIAAHVLETVRLGNDFSAEVEILGVNNTVLSVYYRAHPIRDHDKKVIGLVNVFTDITDKKESERKLRESEKMYRDLYESSPGCLWRTNRKTGTFLQANLATARVFGFSSVQELIEKGNAADFYKKPADRATLLQRLEEYGEVDQFKIDLVLADGTEKTLLVSAKDYPEAGWIEGVGTDITEQIRAENSLLRAEEDLRITLNSIGDAVIATDTAGRILRMNPAAETLTGWDFSEAAGKQLVDVFILHDTRTGRVLSDPMGLILGGSCFNGVSDHLTLINRNSASHQIAYSGAPIRDLREETTGIVIVFRDISEEYRIREELRESEERFRNLAELLPVGVFEARRDLTVTFANSEAVRMFGLSIEDVNNHLNALDLLSEESRRKAESNLERRLIGDVIPVVEYMCKRKDGSFFPALLYINPIQNESGEYVGIRGVGIDITRRKEMEEKLKIMSMHDALTHLYNRAFFEEEMVRLADPQFRPLSIIVCDIDGLKLINETMGHRKGDELLKATARILTDSCPEEYITARIGGDEFAILLPKVPEHVTESICRTIQQEVDRHNAETTDLHVSLSVGYAVSNDVISDPTEIFKIADHNMYRTKLHQSRSSRSDIIQALVKTLEARDYVAEGHAARLQIHIGAMGKKLGLSDSRQRDLNLLCRFHDLGKVGIPDRILMKPGPLSDEEFREVKGHCEIGYRIALTVEDLAPIADYILKHHEWWDGTGYPLGLKGEEIPIESRILAIADTYDAMTHDRPYQKALTKTEAVEVLKKRSGRHFDPNLLEVFLSIIDAE